MRIRESLIGLGLALMAMSAAAQVTGSGTSGTVPEFTGTSAIGNSPISISGGNVGIGTTTPAAQLDIRGSGIMNIGTGLEMNSSSESSANNFQRGMGNVLERRVGELHNPGSSIQPSDVFR